MPVRVEDRDVYVNTRGTQTVKICTPHNKHGEYEEYYRTSPPFVLSKEQIEDEVARFKTLAELKAWLVCDRKAKREPKKEAAPRSGAGLTVAESSPEPPSGSPPVPVDSSNPSANRFKPIDPSKTLYEILDSVRQLTYMKQHSETLLLQLDERLQRTFEKAPDGRTADGQTYELQRSEKPDSAIRERYLEKLIWMQWGYEAANKRGQQFFGDACRFIQTYQMPLQGTWGDKGWGKIDLLGVTHQGLPVVIELKPEKSNDPPLRMLAEGLAYACALRKAWNTSESKFRDEWQAAMRLRGISQSYSQKLTEIPVILLAPSEFWTRKIGSPGERSNGKVREDAWPPFIELTNRCALHGYPIHLVKFEVGRVDPGREEVSRGAMVALPGVV